MIKKIIVSLFLTGFMVGVLWAEDAIELEINRPEETKDSPTLAIEIVEEEPIEKEKRESSLLRLEKKFSYPNLSHLKPLPLPQEAKINKRLLLLLLEDLKSKNPFLRYRAAKTLGLVGDEERILRIKRALNKRLKKEGHPQIRRVLADSLFKIELRVQAQERRKR